MNTNARTASVSLVPKALLAGSYPSWPAWVGGVLASHWASTPLAVRTLIYLIGLDFVSGVIAAMVVDRRFDIGEAERGLGRKLLLLILVGAAHLLTSPLHLGVDFSVIIANALSITEGASITENCARAGVPVPQPLLDLLTRAKKVMGKKEQADSQAAGS